MDIKKLSPKREKAFYLKDNLKRHFMEQQKDNRPQGHMNGMQLSQGQHHVNGGKYQRNQGQQSQSFMNSHAIVSREQSQLSKTSVQSTGDKPVKQGFAYVVRRMEKLTTALYLVTDIMSEREPMKWKAREIVVDLLSDITIASSLPVSEQMTMLRNAIKKTEKVVAFLDVAMSSHLMTEMNGSMLKKEYLALKDNLQEEWSSVYGKSKSIFSESFFEIPAGSVKELEEETKVSAEKNLPQTTQNVSRTSTQIYQTVVHTDIKDTNNISEKNVQIVQSNDQRQTPVSSSTPSVPTPVWADKKVSLPVSHTQNFSLVPAQRPEVGAVQTPATEKVKESVPQPIVFSGGEVKEKNEGGRDDRRKIILDLIKEKPALTVKDITNSIPQVSEKTIQRELLAMVSENVLVKRGERRWSTYSLRTD